MTQFHIFDILAVAAIGIIAVFFLVKTVIKMRKNKCATMCNGCSGGACSSKSFAKSGQLKKIQINVVH